MKMPSFRGKPIHQIMCEHPAKDLAEFCSALEENEFVIVNEFYYDKDVLPGEDPWFSVGQTALNYRMIGKIKDVQDFSGRKKGKFDQYGETE